MLGDGSTREEELLHCLYVLPVALLRIDSDGSIGLINARAASLLQELGVLRADSSGFALLRALDSGLATRTEATWLTPGVVARRERLQRGGRQLALTVQIVNPGCGLVTIEEAWD